MKLFHNIFLSLVLLSSATLSASVMASPDPAADMQVDTAQQTDSAINVVNINTASAQQIADSIKGIGEHKARAIVEYRDTHGKFKSIQELEKVAGVGAKTIDKNKANLSL